MTTTRTFLTKQVARLYVENRALRKANADYKRVITKLDERNDKLEERLMVAKGNK